jgi:hypothetical protein
MEGAHMHEGSKPLTSPQHVKVGELLVMQINMTISNNKWHQHFNCIRIHCQNYYI